MPYEFGNAKKKNNTLFTTNIKDREELSEITKITEMLNSDEQVLLVAKESRIKPGGSYLTPNIVYATDRRIIIRDPYMLGLKENIVDIPYDIITSVKLEKNILSSTIRFKAPGLVSSKRLGMMEEIIDGQEDEGGTIRAIPKKKAEELIEIIRRRMHWNKRPPSTVDMNGQESNLQVNTKRETIEKGELNTYDKSYSNSSLSIADELAKLAKLRQEGVISEAEFVHMKYNLIRRT
jgi:hypothetical protein